MLISSTVLDLPGHRKQVQDAILRAGLHPLAMEHESAVSNSDALRLSFELVDEADLYVGIFAERYGFIPGDEARNPQAWSVTEHEYRRAVTRGIPRLIFLADKDHKFLSAEIDFDPEKREKLQALKEELAATEICGGFSTPEILHSRVVQSLFEEKAKHGPAIPAEPTAEPRVASPPDLYSVPPYTPASRFVGRRAELAELDTWAASLDPIMVVEAIGGMGKSALTWEWVRQRAESAIPSLAGRIWWSFYERGTSMHTFLRHALAYVTRQDPESLRNLDSYGCGQQLLIELRRKPYLLVLDGFERVLTAYHYGNKVLMRDPQVPSESRECINPKDGDALRQLVHCGPSKVLVSTRLMPKLLEDRCTHQLIPGVRHLELEGLAQGDVLRIVRHARVRGRTNNILKFVDQFGRHALVLRIVCGMVIDYPIDPGNFDSWQADPYFGGSLRLSNLPRSERHTHILEYSFRQLPEKHRQLLSRIAVLSDSAHYSAIAKLNPFLPDQPVEVPEPSHLFDSPDWRRLQSWYNNASSQYERDLIEAEKKNCRAKHAKKALAHQRYLGEMERYFGSGEYRKALADFHAALADLEDRGLLQWDREVNTYDMHPVVRAYAFDQLEEGDRRSTYNTIRDHFASLPPENVKEATELAHVKNGIETLRSLVGAGCFMEAVNLYLSKFNGPLFFSVGAFHTVVDVLTPMVGCDQSGVPLLLNAVDRSLVKNSLALSLKELGRIEEAISLHEDCLRVSLELRNWHDVAIDVANLGMCLLNMNQLALVSRLAVLAGRLDDITFGSNSQLFRAILAVTEGRLQEGELLLGSLRKAGRQINLPGDVEYWSARLQFIQGRLSGDFFDHTEEIALTARNFRKREYLAVLRAEWNLCNGYSTPALDAIEQALSITRRIGVPAPRYLGIRALVLAQLGHPAEARETLAEAEEVWVERGPGFPVVVSEAWLALGDRERACEWIRRAYPLAWADGPPHINWYELERCRKIMADLDESWTQLPSFDPSRLAPVPFESEIQNAIDEIETERLYMSGQVNGTVAG